MKRARRLPARRVPDPWALLAAALLVASLVAGCAGLAPSEPAPLDVLSFNIRYANPGDGADTWDRRTDLVFGVIRDHDPDVVGLQEALPRQMDALREAFPAYRFVGVGRDGDGRGEHAALMVREDRLEVVEHGDFWLSPTADVVASRGWDAALTRICSWAVLRERAGGAEARRESAGVIVRRRARHEELPVIVTGDLNAGEGSPPLEVLTAGGLRDTFRDVHPDARVVGTFNGFRGTADGEKIDYVLVDDRWSTLDAAIVRDHEDGRYPSDHFPVSATVVLRR